VTTAFAVEATAITLKMPDQFMALQGFGAPASTESGSSSIKSASAAIAFGTQTFESFAVFAPRCCGAGLH
jgi:hypothetical protein